MTAELSALAKAAGLAEHWTDARQQARVVAPETLRALLRAMDLPADSDADIRDSQQRLDGARGEARLPAMLVGIAGGRLKMPPACAGPYEISAAHARPLTGETATDAAGMPEIAVPPVPGYYTLTTRIGAALLAVAPASAPTPSQLLGQPRPRAWGLAAQVYSLRRGAEDPVHATHGYGDFGALRELAVSAGAAGADALAISPVHAMFAADPEQYSRAAMSPRWPSSPRQ